MTNSDTPAKEALTGNRHDVPSASPAPKKTVRKRPKKTPCRPINQLAVRGERPSTDYGARFGRAGDERVLAFLKSMAERRNQEQAEAAADPNNPACRTSEEEMDEKLQAFFKKIHSHPTGI